MRGLSRRTDTEPVKVPSKPLGRRMCRVLIPAFDSDIMHILPPAAAE